MPNLITIKLDLLPNLSPCDQNVSVGCGRKYFEKIIKVKWAFSTHPDYLRY